MIVIVIIGVVYTLVVSKIQNVAQEKTAPNFATLKEYLFSFLYKDDKEARLICLDSCQDCSIYVDKKKVESIKSFFDSSVESYSYDFLLGAVPQKYNLFFNAQNIQEDVCFSFAVDKDKVAEQTLVVYKDRTYDYSSYFKQTSVYGSLNEATQAREELIQSIMQ